MIDDALRAEDALARCAAPFLVVFERQLTVLLRGAAQLRKDALHAPRRRRGTRDPLRELRVELSRFRREVPGQLRQRRGDGGIGGRRFQRGCRQRQRLEGRQLRRARKALIERHADPIALVHADVDEIVGREGRPADEAEQLDVLAQLLGLEAELQRELGQLDPGPAPHSGHDEQQPAQPLALAVLLGRLPRLGALVLHRRPRRLGLGLDGALQREQDALQRAADLVASRGGRLDLDAIAERENLRHQPVDVADGQRTVPDAEDALRDRLAARREPEGHLFGSVVGPPPRFARTIRFDGRIEAFGRLEVGRVRLLRVDLDRLDAIDEKDALLALLVAPADQAPGAPAEGEAPGIDVAFAALAGLSLQVGGRLVPDVDAFSPRDGLAERAQLLRPARIAGANDEEPACGRAAHRLRVSSERDLPQRVLQILREGKIARGQRRGPR